MKAMEFWFSVGSTYSYLSVMRLSELAEARGGSVDWRPFNVREIMVEMDNVPFATKPAKAAYMWRDIERRAAAHGLPVKVPATYPLPQFEEVNRIATLARQEGWCVPFVRESYRSWFQDRVPAGTPESLAAILPGLGQDVARVQARADEPAIHAALGAATDEARARGIFGAPSFVAAGTEMFWGDDRLEEALEWHTTRGGAHDAAGRG
ncbi:2-hydroxychromene-2-carboxylate isomerase [Lutimaribacter sp. EGI FJ00015]|uniref:2-hydroxychromene-2-carboxylate isomerase n=1 Tax=Lutimaribacter degradans TaxID=2945989 RepID=A0ACC5ZXQ7_9RHOB|nr:2-hydroxychromene-2-carboxylate isomerase [Lutimaribacter sp. EGI FJ00013]MCM2562846.1 2-hydroxychromene-2-carboxylate isomerase [Lutimaribacter sp. EGI FJ00013]MCO0614003.1 2-hydroxychromene-2-carboxylate isomerase [Lutimaribacter sp. EGI FJ00015]MCO0636975.1 2-hydroxychromene-2-carboxylate isomerase [Lutimaribacter sp. EGI FJ00014]